MSDPAGRTPFRLTRRSAVGAFMCAVGAFAASCLGGDCYTPPTDPGSLSTTLAPKYALSYIADGPIPYNYADSAGLKLRVWSDTLVLNSDLSYAERGRIGQLNPTTGDELIKNYALAGSNSYTVDASGNPSFPKLLAGAGVGKKEPSYTYATLSVTINSKVWYFYPMY
jgi:hypothetical protein